MNPSHQLSHPTLASPRGLLRTTQPSTKAFEAHLHHIPNSPTRKTIAIKTMDPYKLSLPTLAYHRGLLPTEGNISVKAFGAHPSHVPNPPTLRQIVERKKMGCQLTPSTLIPSSGLLPTAHATQPSTVAFQAHSRSSSNIARQSSRIPLTVGPAGQLCISPHLFAGRRVAYRLPDRDVNHPRDQDILSGHNPQHAGNQKFAQLVDQLKFAYFLGSKTKRGEIVDMILKVTESEDRRFFKLDQYQEDANIFYWTQEVNPRGIVSQRLRDAYRIWYNKRCSRRASEADPNHVPNPPTLSTARTAQLGIATTPFGNYQVADRLPGKDVKQARDQDILLGRGKHLVQQAGNEHLAQLVDQSKEAYFVGKGTKKQTLVTDILDTMKNKDRRFLEQKQFREGVNVFYYWTQVADSRARNKVTQALRDAYKNRDKKRLAAASSSSKPKVGNHLIAGGLDSSQGNSGTPTTTNNNQVATLPTCLSDDGYDDPTITLIDCASIRSLRDEWAARS